MSNSYNNDANYSIYVMACTGGYPDKTELSSPRVSIHWTVTGSYESENLSFKKPIEYYNSRHKYEDAFASLGCTNDDYMSPQSRDIISRMISDLDIPFELDRLIGKDRISRISTIKPLNSVDEMIRQILQVIKRKIDAGRKWVDLIVEVDKQITIAHEEYQEKIRAEKQRGHSEALTKLEALYRRQMDAEPRDRVANYLTDRCYVEIRTQIIDAMRANEIPQERILEAIRESFEQAEMRPRPASKASVAALETFVFDGRGEGGESPMCVICRDDIRTACEVKRLPCSHLFCKGCIEKWLNHWCDTCPICKFELPKREEETGK